MRVSIWICNRSRGFTILTNDMTGVLMDQLILKSSNLQMMTADTKFLRECYISSQEIFFFSAVPGFSSK